MTFPITKTAIQAKTRQLKCTWDMTLDFRQPTIRSPRSKETLMKLWMLQSQGFRISISQPSEEPSLWCEENCSGLWATTTEQVLITQDEFNLEMLGEPIILGPNYAEDMMSAALARQIQYEIDCEILETLGIKSKPAPTAWYWFENTLDAIRFKLTWDGE